MSTALNSGDQHFLVVGKMPWNLRHFEEILSSAPGNWHFASNRAELESQLSQGTDWKYVFFLHWSHKVPQHVLSAYTCVCFHMTDVPFGRGGSPLQNLIIRGLRETKLTALRMTEEFDAGPVFLKQPLSLEGGTAEEIYIRASLQSCQMAIAIAAGNLRAVPQEGEATYFPRRKPEESLLPSTLQDLRAVHDFIRMLDAESYPHAFIQHGNLRMEIRRSSVYDGEIRADLRITLDS